MMAAMILRRMGAPPSVAGYALTLACSLLAREEGGLGIGHVYFADSIGSVGGGILFSFVLVQLLDHIAILVCPAVLNLLVAGAMGFRTGHKLLSTIAGVAAAAVVAATAAVRRRGLPMPRRRRRRRRRGP